MTIQKHLPLVESQENDIEFMNLQELKQHYYFCLCTATVTDLISLYGSGLHVEVPDFDRQVVAGHHVASTVAELYIRDG